MNDESLNHEIKKSMDALIDGIDVDTQVKLNEARHAAINQQQPKQGIFSTTRWSLLGAGVAVVMVVGFVLIQLPEQPAVGASAGVLFEDLEMLTHEADTEFYQDLEFLTWLGENNWEESDI